MFDAVTFVTGNANKAKEASSILGVEFSRRDLPTLHEIQTTSVDEAVKHKAEEAYRLIKKPVLVEDSGLVFDAWNGLPGALIKWFELSVKIDGLLKMLENEENRTASALCSVAIHDGEKVISAGGLVKGRISKIARGANGFGWDSIFIPNGDERTYGEMEADEKNQISHRRLAYENLKKKLPVNDLL